MNPKVFSELESLVNFGVAKSFLNFVACMLIAKKCTEKQVLDYVEEIKIKHNQSKFAQPRHGYSRVPSRSGKHSQFWYAK